MKRRNLALPGLVAAAVLFSTFTPALASVTTGEDLERLAKGLYSLGVDGERAYDIKNATIVKDMATIRLDSGTLVFSEAIEGVAPLAVFVGKGSVTVTPTRKMDREMLTLTARDHLNKDVGGMLNAGISAALFMSEESFWAGLKDKMEGPRKATEKEAGDALSIMRDRLGTIDVVGAGPEYNLIGWVMNNPVERGVFSSDLKTDEFGWLGFSYSPNEAYEVNVWSFQPVGALFMRHRLVRAHKREDLDQAGHYIADPHADRGDAIDTKHYTMDVEIPDLEQILLDVNMTFTPKMDGLKFVTLDLVNDIYGPHWNSRAKWIDIESLTDAEGNALPHIHRKNKVVVIPKSDLVKGQDVTWNFKLREKTLIQLSNVHWLMLNTYPWFPQYGYLGGQYTFDWTVKTVKPLSATGSGRSVKTWEEAGMNAVQMVFDRPVQFPSIIFGRYESESGEYVSKRGGGHVDLAVYSWPLTIFKITDPQTCRLLNLNCPVDSEITVPRSKPDDVINESKVIFDFMEDLYGAYPYDKLDVAMMAPGMGFGQAPPGFVQLTGEAFMSSSAIANSKYADPAFIHGFYSHEVAHQWWGHKIGWIAEEDQWLSEAFAEYSSALYVLNYLGKDAYDDKLRRWKENAEIGDPHGSIAWSNNMSGVNGGSWRTKLIYDKGAYVVHMLRMLIGLDNYKKAMQNLFSKHGYTNVTTRAVQEECEKLAGYSLDFFFDQWFRGTGIPVFEYGWTSTPTPDGKFMVEINIDQRDKENFKQVLMPVYIYFKGQKEPMIRARPITDAEHVYKLKLPQEPERIVLDEDHDILGDMISRNESGM